MKLQSAVAVVEEEPAQSRATDASSKQAALDSAQTPTMLGALQAFAVLARLHHIACDASVLLHQLGKSPDDIIHIDDLLLVVKQQGLKAKRSRSTADRLPHTPLPALAVMRDGAVTLLAQCDGQLVLLQRFGEGAEPAAID